MALKIIYISYRSFYIFITTKKEED